MTFFSNIIGTMKSNIVAFILFTLAICTTPQADESKTYIISLHQFGGFAGNTVTKITCVQGILCKGKLGLFTETNANIVIESKAKIDHGTAMIGFEMNGAVLTLGSTDTVLIDGLDREVAYRKVSLRVPVFTSNGERSDRVVDEPLAQVEIMIHRAP